jgi:hypothetical protein
MDTRRARTIPQKIWRDVSLTATPFPGNGRAVANAMPPNVRASDSRDNLQHDAQRPRHSPRNRQGNNQWNISQDGSPKFCRHDFNHDSQKI